MMFEAVACVSWVVFEGDFRAWPDFQHRDCVAVCAYGLE